jgi:hypothetical protein
MLPPCTCGYLGGAAFGALGWAAREGHEGRDVRNCTACYPRRVRLYRDGFSAIAHLVVITWSLTTSVSGLSGWKFCFALVLGREGWKSEMEARIVMIRWSFTLYCTSTDADVLHLEQSEFSIYSEGPIRRTREGGGEWMGADKNSIQELTLWT